MGRQILVCLTAWLGVWLHVPAGADERAAELMTVGRAALGGAKLENVTTISASGAFRRIVGEREIEGDLTIELAAPDRIKRTEDIGFPGGPTVTRVTALNAGDFWTDSTNRGGGGFRARFGGGGGDSAAFTEADRERFRRLQQDRLRSELDRYLLVWLMRSDTPAAYAGRAEAEDGSAEVLEFGRSGQSPVRLFLDRRTHLPLMLTYEDVRPRIRVRRNREGPPDPEELKRLMAEQPQRATFELRFEDFRAVDGVQLPHRITQSIDGKPTEEWTVDRYQVNPAFKPSTFSRP